EEEADAAELANAVLIVSAELIDRHDDVLLKFFLRIGGVAGTEGEVDATIRIDGVDGVALRNADRGWIDEESALGVESEAADVVLVDVVVEGVPLGGIDGIEFIDLGKVEALEGWEGLAGHADFF